MDAMLLKVPDVVACLGVSRAKVYELMASGELPSVRVGGSRRIRASDLERFVCQRRLKTDPLVAAEF